MGVVHAIQRALNTVIDWSDFLRKLFALGSDGAVVMLENNRCDFASRTTINDCSPLLWLQA